MVYLDVECNELNLLLIWYKILEVKYILYYVFVMFVLDFLYVIFIYVWIKVEFLLL